MLMKIWSDFKLSLTKKQSAIASAHHNNQKQTMKALCTPTAGLKARHTWECPSCCSCCLNRVFLSFYPCLVASRTIDHEPPCGELLLYSRALRIWARVLAMVTGKRLKSTRIFRSYKGTFSFQCPLSSFLVSSGVSSLQICVCLVLPVAKLGISSPPAICVTFWIQPEGRTPSSSLPQMLSTFPCTKVCSVCFFPIIWQFFETVSVTLPRTGNKGELAVRKELNIHCIIETVFAKQL